MGSNCPTCGREITMQLTGGFCCWPTREPTDKERIDILRNQLTAATSEVERLKQAFAWLESDIRYVDAANILAKLEEWLTYCQQQGKEPPCPT